MIKRILFPFLLLVFVVTTYGQNSLQGIVTDAENGESVIGCNVILQGTTLGTITGMNGEYVFKNLPTGTYNVVFSFISYEKQIQKITITKAGNITNNIKLKPATTQIKDVVVTGTRRTDTELSLLMNTKISALTVNGISSQQIAKSQDKDASEVIRRVPGVSIRDGKFVIVRGLTERYNSVWLNGSSTPSSESDVRAFSFDVIPSGQIDNILIYKTAAPELPSDFAGAMINIKTKSLIDKNSITFSYSYGNHQGTTGKEFYTYQGGKTDWMGYDDGTRGLPSAVPSTDEYKSLLDHVTYAKVDKINEISKSFNKIMTPFTSVAKPDADFQLSLNNRFILGDISIGAINAIGYNSTNTNENCFRAAYWAYPDTSYRYMQRSFASKVRVSALSNWTFIFGNNQKIEFRNLFNNNGVSKVVLKEGFDFYRTTNERAYELGYESRATYSGQLAGTHTFSSGKIKLDWVAGYSYADKKQPDLRRIKATPFDTDFGSQYMINFSNSIDAISRMTLNNKENIYNASINYSHLIKIGNFKPEIKAGAYYEKKERNFDSRVFGYIKMGMFDYKQNNFSYYPIESYNGQKGFDEQMFTSITEMLDTKIDYMTGTHIIESTQKADSYSASNKLGAGYIALNVPITKWINTYLGVRVEKNTMTLNGYKRDGTDKNPINVNIDSLNIFPSINATLNISEKLLLRLASGKTVNRPEFREVSPFVFYSFEDNAMTYGNTKVVNSYIQNSDVRFEWYPTSEEIVSLGAFYKDFTNPIESKILYTGSGWNYTFDNVRNGAKSYGVELDIRKRLHEFEKSGAFKFLSNFTFVVNASLIKSVIKTDSISEGASERTLQGQSPYIINVAVFYNDQKSKIITSLMYNKVGERIATVGDIDTPHIYERPFNSLDFTFEKGITKWMSIKFGIKNILDDDVVFQQYQKYSDKGEKKIREQVSNKYKPGRQFKLGISVNL
ncbi:MAG: carboxypeptidase-like regulatory domain-containing protein [Paludibacter sp.]